MSTPKKDIEKVEVRVKWDPSAYGEPANDLDIIAATYETAAPYGAPPISCTSTAGPPTARSL